MDGFDRLHVEQDEYIRKTLAKDEVVNQKVINNLTKFIDKSNIKATRFLKLFIRLILVLIIILIIYLVF